ncbi:MAG: guanylate kinase [Candidatus Riflebacteria bacterium]|nr:guanylate kinase [Candidatus Riflebacteria bacterium]
MNTENVIQKNRKGRLFVVSGPSGVGKTVLAAEIVSFFSPGLVYSVSATSRNPRGNEKDGKDYFFLAKGDFETAISENKFAEWALVHGNYYGTPKSFLDSNLEKSISVLMNIDVQGADKIAESYPESVKIFILPPSMDVLEERLRKRNMDSEKDLVKRLSNAKEEILHKTNYHHLVINDNFDKAVAELKSIFSSYIFPEKA